ncbi:MAG: hypothetical protein WBM28_12930 [Burkholderiales bacterium]
MPPKPVGWQKISPASAYKLVADLERLGIPKVITGGKRGKTYLFAACLKLFKSQRRSPPNPFLKVLVAATWCPESSIRGQIFRSVIPAASFSLRESGGGIQRLEKSLDSGSCPLRGRGRNDVRIMQRTFETLH